MNRLTLYCATIDADCLAARLTLAVLGLGHDTVPVDAYPGVDTDSRRILDAGPLPILRDARGGKAVVAGLRAVLEHLAPDGLTPDGVRWLDFACDEASTLRDARTKALVGAPFDAEPARDVMLTLEDERTRRRFGGPPWFSGDAPGIADLALYPAVALSRDLGLEHDEFPALRGWLRRVRALAPDVHMPGILDPV